MPPELFRGDRGDPRSDLFSLGVILFECAGGWLPWGDDAPLGRLAGIQGASAPRELPPSLDGQTATLIRQLLSAQPSDRPASAGEVMARLDRQEVALVTTGACRACGRRRPHDLPSCPSCGDQPASVRHTAGGQWMLVLQPQQFDADRAERLLRVLDAVTGQRVALKVEPVTWMFWKHGISPPEERSSSLELPALLFADLDEKNARALERLFGDEGLDARACTRQPLPTPIRWGPSLGLVVMQGTIIHFACSVGYALPLAVFGLGGVAVGGAELWMRKKWRKGGARFRLRPEGALLPRARSFLDQALRDARTLRTAQVRDLLSDVTVELFRLAARAERATGEGPASPDGDPAAERLMAAAPALLQRLVQWGRRLDDLGAALDAAPVGQAARLLAGLSRDPSSSGGEDDADLRRERQRLLEDEQRRARAEDERAMLIAELCRVLGELRLTLATAAAGHTPDRAAEDGRLSTALSEVEELLAQSGRVRGAAPHPP